jgi:hypothetical protein
LGYTVYLLHAQRGRGYAGCITAAPGPGRRPVGAARRPGQPWRHRALCPAGPSTAGRAGRRRILLRASRCRHACPGLPHEAAARPGPGRVPRSHSISE